jgi:flagellar hook-associated protein 3 FlgL
MSTTLSSVTDFGTLNQIVDATANIKQNIDQLTTETSSGYLATSYAGLGAAAAPALDLSAQIAVNTQLQTNTQTASTIQQAAQSALGQIESVASNFATQANQLQTLPGSAPTVAAAAQDALQQVAGLLDTEVGGIYIFAGQDSGTAPIPNPNDITQSAFTTAIQNAVAGLTTNGAAATTAATLAIASPGGTTPFSASLEAAGAQGEVDVGNGVRVALAPLANTNSNAQSTGTGTTSTGSYTRDILMSLATLSGITTTQAESTEFPAFIQNTVTTLNGAVSAINTDIGALGDRQDQITTAQTDLSDTSTTLQTQLSSLQNADLTTVAAQLSQAQTQLQASYQILSSLGTLTLARFLPA